MKTAAANGFIIIISPPTHYKYMKTTLDQLLDSYGENKNKLAIELRRLSNIVKFDEDIEDLSRKQKILLCRLWLEEQIKQGKVCEKCKMDKNLTLDHIVPVYLLETFGVDESRLYMPDNYQVLCKRCNSFKSKKLDPLNPKTKPILLNIIDDIWKE